MNIKICENLRIFRREHGNTQEELSNHLGISVQAVSKWERGEGYPDITLLPSIAAFYGKTVDELLGCGEMEKHEKMKEIMKQYNRNNHEGKIEDNITLLHNALKEFPGSLSLMSDLAFSLLWSTKEEYMDECIETCEEILDKSLDDGQRNGALQTIIYAYVHKGNRSKAREYAEKLPDSQYTRSVMLESILEGKERLKQTQCNIVTYVTLIDRSVDWMLSAKEYAPEEKIFAYETVVKLIQLFFYDENYLSQHTALHSLWMKLSKEYARCKDREKTLTALKTAYLHAFELDHFKAGKYTSMFADELVHSGGLIKNFEASHVDLLMKAMEDPVFDFVRETEAFRQIAP